MRKKEKSLEKTQKSIANKKSVNESFSIWISFESAQYRETFKRSDTHIKDEIILETHWKGFVQFFSCKVRFRFINSIMMGVVKARLCLNF